ncbi:DoxX family protein [Microbacterium sp. H1-D42]|uniref:DoxX family protein n=1 Tax=Microbacterium sp. H1-D42 TaxID=2925844 RepID=UPI001F52E753|nr:DoxX family protein [Microbacterium sp. H1-D42]UNK70986.1 DoxX family protein [Microbacterium sp. H1-D42]
MEPLIMLVAVTALLWLLGALGAQALRHFPTALRGGLAAMFALTGVSHFIGMREELIAMVPDFVPTPELAVTATGLVELAGAIGLLIPRLAGLSAAGLTLLLIGVFPANIALALSDAPLPWYDELLWRTLTQLVFLAATSAVVIDRRRAGFAYRAAGHHSPAAHSQMPTDPTSPLPDHTSESAEQPRGSGRA